MPLDVRTLVTTRAFTIVACVVGAVLPTARAAADEVLGVWKNTPQPDFISGLATQATGIRKPWYFGPNAGPFTGPGLFENLVLTPASLNQLYEANAGNDPDFTYIADLLTNGTNDFVASATFAVPGGSGFSAPWTEQRFATYPGANGVWDFSGAQITRVVMRVDRALLEVPGSNPNGDGNWTDFNFSHTLLIYGVVPEPASALWLAAGAGAALVRRRRR